MVMRQKVQQAAAKDKFDINQNDEPLRFLGN
jgi:hypothetical protein